MNLAETVRVWVRSLGNACRVRVEGRDNTQWLVNYLSNTPALVGLKFVDIQPHGATCTFEIPNSTDRTLTTLETVLARVPGVKLMLQPESN